MLIQQIEHSLSSLLPIPSPPSIFLLLTPSKRGEMRLLCQDDKESDPAITTNGGSNKKKNHNCTLYSIAEWEKRYVLVPYVHDDGMTLISIPTNVHLSSLCSAELRKEHPT